MATLDSTSRSRSSSTSKLSKKKKNKEHKIHIAAALMPTQAFTIAPGVRCELPSEPGISDTKLSHLNNTALSNSLLRRSLDRSLDLRDSELMQQSLRNSTSEDAALNRSSDQVGQRASVSVERTSGLETGTSYMDSVGGSVRVSVDPSVYASQAAKQASTQRLASEDEVNEEIVAKKSGKAHATFAVPPRDENDADGARPPNHVLEESTSSRPKKGNAALRAENRVLQENIQRLSVELSRYQAITAIQNGEIDRFLHVNKVRPALGPDEPIPLWLVDQKYLSPLFASYDAQVAEKDRLLRESQQRMDDFERRLLETQKSGSQSRGIVVRDIVPVGSVPGGVPSNWAQIVDQCKQVIDENSLQKNTIDKQAKEISQLEKCHVQEVSRLTEQIAVLEAEVAAEHSRYTAMLDRYHSLDEIVKRTGYFEKSLHDGQKLDISGEYKSKELVQVRLKDAEVALMEAETKYAAVYDRAKNFAESIVRLSSENRLLMEEKAKRERSLAKYKQRVATMQEALLQLQSKDSEKNNLLKELMAITDGISKQRNELAENLQRASTSNGQAKDHELTEKDLKMKWLESMLQNSAARAEKEELERRKLEENLHAVWEAAVMRDRNRHSSNSSGRFDRTSVRNGDFKFT